MDIALIFGLAINLVKRRNQAMTDKDIYLWRVTVKTSSQDQKDFEFCLQNNILGVGWCAG